MMTKSWMSELWICGGMAWGILFGSPTWAQEHRVRDTERAVPWERIEEIARRPIESRDLAQPHELQPHARRAMYEGQGSELLPPPSVPAASPVRWTPEEISRLQEQLAYLDRIYETEIELLQKLISDLPSDHRRPLEIAQENAKRMRSIGQRMRREIVAPPTSRSGVMAGPSEVPPILPQRRAESQRERAPVEVRPVE